MKRPFVDEFLVECAKDYEVVVFTASLAKVCYLVYMIYWYYGNIFYFVCCWLIDYLVRRSTIR